jgi:hypothetical protein
MESVKVEEAARFYEEDEDPREVFAAFDAGQKGRTGTNAEALDRGVSAGCLNRPTLRE